MRCEIKIFNEDCLPAMKKMEDNQFFLALVDPPYGIPEAFKGGFASNKSGRRKSPFAKNMINKEWDVKPKPDYFKELFRVSENQIIWGFNYFIENLVSSRGIAVWVKPQQANGDHPFFSHCELAWTSFKKPAKVFQKVTIESGVARLHPTQKPVQLYKWLLQNYAKEGDKILDTHLGSGSIAIACWDLCFDLTAYEIDREYYEGAKARLERHQAQGQLF